MNNSLIVVHFILMIIVNHFVTRGRAQSIAVLLIITARLIINLKMRKIDSILCIFVLSS